MVILSCEDFHRKKTTPSTGTKFMELCSNSADMREYGKKSHIRDVDGRNSMWHMYSLTSTTWKVEVVHNRLPFQSIYNIIIKFCVARPKYGRPSLSDATTQWHTHQVAHLSTCGFW